MNKTTITLIGLGCGLTLGACAAERQPESAEMSATFAFAQDEDAAPRDRGLRARAPTEAWREFLDVRDDAPQTIRPAWVERDRPKAEFLWPIEAFFFGPETVCLPDDRQPVPDPTLPPWNGNCLLIITMQDGSLAVGTGWLMGPRLVVTAGHCVHEGAGGEFYQQIQVIPGAHAGMAPFNSQVSRRFRAASQWITGGVRAHDYGAIILDRPFDATLSIHTPAVRTDADLQDAEVYMAGYPVDKHGTQWEDRDPISRLRHDQIVYRLDTYGGQSGSAVVHEGAVVGIHNYGGCPNSATRITQAVHAQLMAWLSESER